ncbi:multicopper oxidase family protein [Georgenia muralis]
MRPLTRRQALVLGAAGVGSVVVGGIGAAQTPLPWSAAPPDAHGPGGRAGGGVTPGADGATLTEPVVLASESGVLEVELEMAEREVRLGDVTARLLTYNGTVPGPTLLLRPGDTLRVHLVNRLDDVTNLHVHGLHVSPEGNGDNPFLAIEPGESFDYEIALPDDHPTGTFWYHPHHHGMVADQMFAGLYGAIVVEDDLPAGRVLVVSDVSLTADGAVRQVSMPERMMGREGETVLVNGQVRPRITAAPGERQRWRVVNACTSRHLRLELEGQEVTVLGVDLGRQAEPPSLGDLLLAPGNRADLLVTAAEGTATLRALPHDRGGMMGMMGGATTSSEPVTLATLEVAGPAAEPPAELPPAGDVRDLRDVEPAARRTLTFTMGMGRGRGPGGMTFGFDGRGFDAERTDQEVAAGAVEEWVIDNPTPMDHPFHLHVWPMQVVEAAGTAVAAPTWRDVVTVPAGSRVVVRVPFEDLTGRTVYHCHILDHEDAGMMGVVDVRA